MPSVQSLMSQSGNENVLLWCALKRKYLLLLSSIISSRKNTCLIQFKHFMGAVWLSDRHTSILYAVSIFIIPDCMGLFPMEKGHGRRGSLWNCCPGCIQWCSPGCSIAYTHFLWYVPIRSEQVGLNPGHLSLYGAMVYSRLCGGIISLLHSPLLRMSSAERNQQKPRPCLVVLLVAQTVLIE